jgi:glycosyltransferase involved in cell wall biosynthesis
MIADTPPKFAKKVVKLLKDKKLRERISQNSRQLIERHYNWLEIGQRLIAVYSDLVNKKS